MKWCLFYFYVTFVYNCYVPTYHRFFTAKIASQISKRHLSAWNILTFSRRFSRNLTPREPKKYYLCFIYFNNLVKYFSGARLRRCLISSKTVEISREKFHEIRKTNNAHDVTMTSKRIDFVGSKF
jgi:hypothetical protein